MSKKVGIILAVLAAIMVLCCAGGFFFFKGFANKIVETSAKDQAFIATALTATAKTWDEKVFSTYADENFNKPEHRESTRKQFANLQKKLGSLVSLQKAVEQKRAFNADSNMPSPGFYITYKANAKYEKGDGVFTVTVRNSKNEIKITDIGLDPVGPAKTP